MPDLSGDRIRELRRTEERFRLVAENVDAVILIAAADRSTVEYVNPAYETVYGQSVERLYDDPRSTLDTVHPADRDRYEADLDRMLDAFDRDDAEETYEGEYRLSVDGGIRWIRVQRYPVVEEGSVERFVSVTEDVTDRRELEQTYTELFERTSDGLVLHDPETGEIVDANERFCDMNGYERAELVGEHIDVVTPSTDGRSYDDARERIRRAREEGPQLFEWDNRRKDGTTFPVEVHLTVVDVRGEERVLASVRDITDRKRRERTREEERRKYTTLVEGSNDGVVIVQAGTYAFVNDRFCEITGRSRAELLDTSFDEVFAEDDREVVRERYERRIAGEEPQSSYDVELLTATGDRVAAELTVSRITHEGEPATMATVRDITERKRREVELRTLKQEYETVYENAQDSLFLVDVERGAEGEGGGEPTFVYRRLNDTHGETTGIEDEELRGRSPREAFGADPGAEIEANYRRCLAERETITYEEELAFPAGERTWQTKLSPVIIDGEVRQIVGIARDITERKRLEEELRGRERRLRLIADHIDEVIYLASADLSEIRYVNPAYEEIYGESVAELSEDPRSFVEAAHPDDRDRYERDVERMIDDIDAGDPDEVYEGEYRLRVDGETRWVRVTRSPIENDDGVVDRVVGTVSDVTDQRELERTYRELFESVSDGLVVHDPETGEILDVNDRYCELTGYGHDELVGADIGIVMTADPDYSEAAAKRLIDAAREEGPQLFEWRGARKDGGTFAAEISLTIVELEGRERVLASVRDVTERKRRQREYQQIFDGVNDLISVHDPETGEILDVNDSYVQASGYDESTILDLDVEGLTPDVAGYSEERSREIIQEVAETGDPVTVEWPVETADGERRWYEVDTTPARIGGELRILGISRDVTDRKRHQRIMSALHESTARIQDAATTDEVCEATVAAMEEVLGLSLPVCWLQRDDGGGAGAEDGEGDGAGGRTVLEPVAASDAAREFAGGPGPLEPGTFEYELYERGESAVYDPSARWDRTSLNHALMVPVGDHGVIGAADPGVEEFDEVVLDAARILARHTTTALDRVARARERRESERRMSAILDRIDEAIFLTDSARLLGDGTGDVYVSAGYEDVFGRSYDEFGGDDSMEFIEIVHPDDRQEYQTAMREWVREVERGEHDDRYTGEYRIERPDGERRWIRSDFYPIGWADDTDRFVVVSRDVTERKEREDTLETFHGATRELTEAGSRKEASQVAVDAADGVLGFSHVSIHLYDESEGALRPVSETDRLRETLDFLPSFEPGTSLPWQVFVDGETVRGSEIESETGLYGAGVSDPDLLLPLGSHGVMLVGAPDREFDAETVELAQILAATLEGALNHVRGQHELEQREAELREHRARAERLERLNTVIREIEQATVEESTREAIEAVVCEQLVTVDPYQVAWIAEPNRRSDALVSRATRGADGGLVDTDAVELDGAGVDRHPAAAAFSSGETRTVRNLATQTARGEWRKPILRAGFQSVAAVPVAHSETVYGVLTIIAADPTAFDERAEAILTELGRSVGYAISVLERRAALESDTTTELEFAGRDDDLLFARAARQAEADVALERTVRRSSGAFGAFYTVEGAAPEQVVDEIASLGGVADVTLVSADASAETCLVEVETSSWFGTVFAEHGAVVRTAEAVDEAGGTHGDDGDGDGGARLVVEAPQAADIRALVTSFKERYPGTELVAQRTRERSVQTLLELQDLLGEQLTERQLETLETAYSAGYFDWPRESSGQEIAALLDITQPTFNKHLRTAERKTFSMLLNREYPD
ncbi:PAS domain S-box protein [Salinigranum marinum]|uniref:PAS domain S-box protein n=1 Tax=Salinigranum marinum TaxID=1515595 RepID=UPI002989E1CC|nr:PAS domain S-box protein [Salinigranum marinum]